MVLHRNQAWPQQSSLLKVLLSFVYDRQHRLTNHLFIMLSAAGRLWPDLNYWDIAATNESSNTICRCDKLKTEKHYSQQKQSYWLLSTAAAANSTQQWYVGDIPGFIQFMHVGTGNTQSHILNHTQNSNWNPFSNGWQNVNTNRTQCNSCMTSTKHVYNITASTESITLCYYNAELLMYSTDVLPCNLRTAHMHNNLIHDFVKCNFYLWIIIISCWLTQCK